MRGFHRKLLTWLSLAMIAGGSLSLAMILSAQTAPSLPMSSSGGGSSAATCAADTTCVLTDGSHTFTGAVTMPAGARVSGSYSSGVALSVIGGNSVQILNGGGVQLNNGIGNTSSMIPTGFIGESVAFGSAQYCTINNSSQSWTAFGDRSISLSSPYVGAPAYSGVFSITSNRVGVYGKTAGILVAGWGGTDGYGVLDLSGSSNATSAAQYPVSGDILGQLRFGNVPYAGPGFGRLWCQANQNWTGAARGTDCYTSVTPVDSSVQHTTLKYGSDGSLSHYLDSVLDTPLTFESYRRGPTPGSEPEVGGVFVEDPVTYPTPNIIGAFASLDMGRVNRHIANVPAALPTCAAGLVGHVEYYQDSNDATNAASLCVCAYVQATYGWQIVTGSHCPDDGGGSGVAGLIPAAVRITQSVATAIATATATAVAFDTEVFDTASMFDSGTSTTRVIAPREGYYLVGIQSVWDANVVGNRTVQVRLNGATILTTDLIPSPGAATQAYQARTTLYHFAATDYVEMIATQTSGGNLNIQATMWMVAQ